MRVSASAPSGPTTRDASVSRDFPHSIQKINSITSLEELDGYEAEAKLRGLTGEELAAIYSLRNRLMPKRKRGRKLTT